MILFLDTNVILDLLTERLPFLEAISKIATLATSSEYELVATPLSFGTVNYLIAKEYGQNRAIQKLREFKIICSVCEMDEPIVEQGLHSNMKDFEDALQYFSALKAGSDVIITRNAKDFKNSHIPIMTPTEFLVSINRT
jgi:predicted nucleic acid-binding protein